MKSDIVCIIDQSGSMQHLRDDTIGGFNRLLEDQKKIPGEATLTLTLFSAPYSYSNKILMRMPLQFVKPLDKETYKPLGATALLDAIGHTIDSHGRTLAAMEPSVRPDKVIVAILTDGEENSSKDFKKYEIAQRIKHQQDNYKWEFIFLGANMDAFAEAGQLNIHTAYEYTHDKIGIRSAFFNMNAAVASSRTK